MGKDKTIRLVTTALLAAIAIAIPLIMPVKVVIPPFTATLASHVPLILAMFISPLSAIFVTLGSALGFLVTHGPIVAARAAMHVFFAAAGAYMYKKGTNLYIIAAVTLLLHTLSDMFIVYLLFAFFGQTAITAGNTMQYVQFVIAVGTSVHHVLDFFIATAVYIPLSKQKSSILK
jgi:niacin transporter